jgi:hypothetical protein
MLTYGGRPVIKSGNTLYAVLSTHNTRANAKKRLQQMHETEGVGGYRIGWHRGKFQVCKTLPAQYQK